MCSLIRCACLHGSSENNAASSICLAMKKIGSYVVYSEVAFSSTLLSKFSS